ncbi:polysaccharide deacetylase family protein [Patescibacteria group bacterium]|nr:polysaccharide deacetylase family protein [Patescibacteria group bacterium]
MLKKRVLLIPIIILIVMIPLVPYFIYTFDKSAELHSGHACLALTFDDGVENHYDEVFMILKERGHKATFFIIANITSWRGDLILTDDKILEMQNEGFEIGSHSLTHPLFTSLSPEEVVRELKESKQNLESRGLEITSFSFPFSNYSEETLLEANKYYEIVRDNYILNSNGNVYNAQPIYSESKMEEVCERIKEAKARNKLLIFVFHKVQNNPLFWDISKEDFIKLLECAEENDLEINTLKKCIAIVDES